MRINYLMLLAFIASLLVGCSDNEEIACRAIDFAEKKSMNVRVCTQLFPPEDSDLKCGGITNYFWNNGQTILIKFLDGSATQIDNVIERIEEWEEFANIDFVVTSGNADVRVSFSQGGSWSYVGIGAKWVRDQNQPTVNFGWLEDYSSAYEYDRVVLHEFGHVLGLMHEHQLPSANVCWDEEYVYWYYSWYYGWDRESVYSNIIEQYSESQTQYSEFDPLSIMTYQIPQAFTTCDWTTPSNSQLSEIDKQFIGEIYPFLPKKRNKRI